MGATMPVKLPLNPKFGPDVRVSLQEEAKLILDGDREVDIVIVDVSHNGFRIRSNDPIRTSSAGAKLNLDRYGEFRIEIRWANGHEAGGVFLDPPPRLD